jgi:pimeloyl-ACP methyl ester carboxylesterase
MSSILIVILLVIGVFVAASVVLGRTTREVGSARDTEYLELEGSWIRYRVIGGGPPVVLVHGWLSSSRIWEQLAARLARRFTVYTLDLSGFGESDKPISGYGVRYGSRLLYAFCAYFGLTRAAIVGHDLGGAMAVKLAADHPDVVGRIVLVATPANEDQIDLPTLLWLTTLPVIGPVYYTLGRFLRPLRRSWMRPFVLDPKDLTEEVVDDAGKPTPAALAKTLSMMRREITQGRLVRQAGIIKVPILVVAGEEDQIVDPQAVDDWARTLPAEVALMDECGHLPMLERPGEFNARVLAFLTGDPRYLDATEIFPEEMAGEDAAVAETPEKPASFTPAEPDFAGSEAPPNVAREQDGRDPSGEPKKGRYEASDQQSAETTEGGRAEEERPRGRVEDGGVPEVPEDLFEWPESLKSRPQDRSRETGQAREERGEDADSGDPEKEQQ